jgi:site-specific recombinase XerD
MNYLEQFKSYLQTSQKASVATVKNYMSDIRKFQHWIEERTAEAFNPTLVTLEQIETFKADMRQLSVNSSDRYISSLRKFYAYLEKEGLFTNNPFTLPEASIAMKPADPYVLKGFKNSLYEMQASEPTIKNYLADIKQFLVWAEEVTLDKQSYTVSDNQLFSKLTTQVIEEYKYRLHQQAHLSPVSINRKLSSIRKYIAFLLSQGVIEAAPIIINTSDTDFSQDEIVTDGSTTPVSTQQTQAESLSEAANSIPEHSPKTYSRFGPLRLFQRMMQSGNFLFDLLAILPLVKVIEQAQYLFVKFSGKGVFMAADAHIQSASLASRTALKAINGIEGVISQRASKSQVQGIHHFITRDRRTLADYGFKVSNLPKEMYAPLSVKNLPFHKKMWHHARFTRPNWYRKYSSYALTHYFHFAILMIVVTTLGVGVYNGVFNRARETKTLAAAPTAPPRILSFQGRLTDNSDNPITATTNLRFAVYSDTAASGAALLWQEVKTTAPDTDGIFNVYLGQGTAIPSSVFTDNSSLYLGITVGTNDTELTPRQQIATVAFASNSETLQGLLPITGAGAGTTNVVLALDSSGNLTVGGSAAPTFQATGGQFTLSGTVLRLATTAGSNSDIQLAPDGRGKIDVQKALFNSTLYSQLPTAAGAVNIDDLLAVNATSSGQSAFTLNQDGAGPLISASASGIARFTVDNTGNGAFAGNLEVSGGNITSGNTTGTIFNSNISTLQLGGASTSLTLGATTGTLALRNPTINLGGGSATTIQTTSNSSLTIGGSTTGDIILGPQNGVAGGTVRPSTNNGIDLGTATFAYRNIYVNNIYSGSSGVSGYWQRALNALSPANITDDILIGGTATSSALIKLGGTTNASSFFNTGGNVGIGTTTPTLAKLQVNGDIVTQNTGSIRSYNVGGTQYAYMQHDGSNMVFGGSTGGSVSFSGAGNRVDIGSSNYVTLSGGSQLNFNYEDNVTALKRNSRGIIGTNGTLEISGGNTTGRAALLVDQIGAATNDIFTASASGTTRLTLRNNGNLGIGTSLPSQLFDVQGGSGIVGQFSGRVVGGNAINTNEFATLGQLNNNQYFQRNLGAISPFNITDDFLLGGTATTSAKFAFINNTGAGTPTASISGNLAIGVPTGANAATTYSALNGGSINFRTSPGGEPGATSRFFIQNDGNIGVGSISPTNTFSVNGSGRFYGAYDETTSNTGVFAGYVSGTPRILLGNGSSTQNWQIDNNGGDFRWYTPNNTYMTLSPTANGSLIIGSQYQSAGSATTIENWYEQTFRAYRGTATPTATNIAYNFTTGSTNSSLLTLLNNGALGIGTTAPATSLHVSAQTGGNAAAIIDQRGTNTPDIFTASSSGTPRFVIRGNGNVGVGTTLPAQLLDVQGGSGIVAQFSGRVIGANAANTNEFATLGQLNSNQYFQRNLGAISPFNITDDVLVGATATASATVRLPGLTNKDAFFNLGTGNLGVGTTAPTSKLHVRTAAAATNAVAISDGTNYTLSAGYTAAGVGYFGGATGTALALQTNGSEKVRIALNGNVGIGSTSPAGLLDVNGTTTGNALVNLVQNTATADILTASAGATTRLTVNYNGQLALPAAGSTGGLLLGGDANFYRSGTNTLHTDASFEAGNGTNWAYTVNGTGQGFSAWGRASTSTQVLGANVAGDSSWRFLLNADGGMSWGNGTTQDTNLYRSGVSILKTDNAFQAASLATGTTTRIDGSGILQNISSVTGNLLPTTTNTYDLGSASLQWNNTYTNNLYINGSLVTPSSLTNYWQRSQGAISPANITDDLLLGSTATSSATVKLPGLTNNNVVFNLGTGNVGINTTNPTGGKLEVNGNILADIATGGGLYIKDTTTNTTERIFGTASSGQDLHIGSDWSGNGTNGNLFIGYNMDATNRTISIGDGGTKTDVKTASNTYLAYAGGNVGIGTTTAGAKLQIDGADNIELLMNSTNTTGTAVALRNSTAGAHNYEFYTTGSGNGPGYFGVYDETADTTPLAISGVRTTGTLGTNATTQIGFWSNANYANAGAFDTAIARNAAGVLKVTNGTTGFGSLLAGNIGINTTSTASFTLQVAGNAGPNATNTYDLGSSSLQWNNVYANTFIQNGAPLTQYWQRNAGAVSPVNITDDLLLGGTATASALTKLGGTTNATTFFNTGGNVGIGTTVPGSKFAVTDNTAGAFAAQVIQSNATGQGIYSYVNSNSSTVSALGVDNSAGRMFTVFGNGNVGIGTTTAGSRLTVVDNSTTYATNITNNNTTGDGLYLWTNNNTATDDSLLIQNNSSQNLLNLKSNGALGLGIYNPTARFQLSNSGLTSLGKSLAILDQYENQDILTASKSGSMVFALNKFGDMTAGQTVLDGSTTANGAGTSSNSLTLTSAALFDVGSYIKLSSTNCVTGVNVCYARITNKIGNVLTLATSLTWANASTVTEVHVSDIGASNTSIVNANKFGGGYFLNGITAGNGSTLYTDKNITLTEGFMNINNLAGYEDLLTLTNASQTNFKVASGGAILSRPTAFIKALSCTGASCTSADTGTFTDNTTEASTSAGTPFTAIGTGTTATFYVGLDRKFASIYFSKSVAAAGVALVREYWNGSVWTAMPANSDGTLNMTVNGMISFPTMPTDWAPNSVNGVSNLYWIRLRSSTNVTTAPTTLSISPTTGNRFTLYAQDGDASSALTMNDSGGITLPSSTTDGIGNLFFGGNTNAGVNGMRMFSADTSGGAFIDFKSGTTTNGIIFRADTTTGGTERMRIQADGNIGIAMAGSAATDRLVVNGNIQASIYKDKENTAYYLDPANSSISLLAAGNVGIGTTVPNQMLTVSGYGSGAIGNTMQIIGTAVSATAQNQVNITSGANSFGLILGSNNSGVVTSGYHCALCSHIVNVQNANLNLGANNAVVLSIAGSGNVGIGSISPTAKLSISGGGLDVGTNVQSITTTDGAISLGSTTVSFTPTTANWLTGGTALLLSGLDYSDIGFHDAGSRVDFIRVGGGVINLGYDGGWGAATTNTAGPFTAASTGSFAGALAANGGISIDGNTVIDDGAGWHRAYGNTGFYNGTYGGGIWMQNSSNVEVYGSKNFYVPAGQLYQAYSSVGTGATANIRLGQFATNCGNTCYLNIEGYRRTAGTTWPGAGFTIGPSVDSSFEPCGLSCIFLGSNSGGSGIITFMQGGTDRAYFDSGFNFVLDGTNGGNFIDGNFPTGGTTTLCNNGGTISNCSSDRTLKTNIQYITSGYMDKIKALKPATFDYTNGDPNDTNISGFIAQDVKDIIPGAVFMGRDGHYVFRAETIIPYVVGAVQETDKRVSLLENASSSANLAFTLNRAGTFTVSDDGSGSYTVIGSDGTIFSKIIALSQAIIGNLRAGAIDAQKITTQSFALGTENMTIAGTSLKDYILGVVTQANLSGNNYGGTIPELTVQNLKTNLISPLASESAVVISGRVFIAGNPLSTKPALDVQGNASISGQLATTSLTTTDATISGTLHAGKIIADDIVGLSAKVATLSATTIINNTNIYNTTSGNTQTASGSGQIDPAFQNGIPTLLSGNIQSNYANIASLSGQFAQATNLQAEFGQFNQGLMVLGPTSLSDTSITGQLSVGGNMVLADNTINVLGADLQLQPLKQGGISFEGGLVAINTDGDLTVGGSAVFQKDVRVNGTLMAKYLSPVPDSDLIIKLPGSTQGVDKSSNFIIQNASGSGVLAVDQKGNVTASGSGFFSQVASNIFNIVRGAQADTSVTETTASASAGTAVIKRFYTERTIYSPYVMEKSLIYVTATSDTMGQTPYIARQTAEDITAGIKGSFTIQISNNAPKDIKINWWIVN